MLPAGECAELKPHTYQEAFDKLKGRAQWLDGERGIGNAERSLVDTILFAVDTQAPDVFAEEEMVEASRLLSRTIDGLSAFDGVFRPDDKADKVELVKLADRRLYGAALGRHTKLVDYVVKRLAATTEMGADGAVRIASNGKSSMPHIKFHVMIVATDGTETVAAEATTAKPISQVAEALAAKLKGSGVSLPAGRPATLAVDWKGDLKIMFYNDLAGGMQCFTGDVVVPNSMFDDWLKNDLGLGGTIGTCKPKQPPVHMD